MLIVTIFPVAAVKDRDAFPPASMRHQPVTPFISFLENDCAYTPGRNPDGTVKAGKVVGEPVTAVSTPATTMIDPCRTARTVEVHPVPGVTVPTSSGGAGQNWAIRRPQDWTAIQSTSKPEPEPDARRNCDAVTCLILVGALTDGSLAPPLIVAVTLGGAVKYPTGNETTVQAALLMPDA